MKIFAKRTKKATPSKDTQSDGDKAVLELLKLDYSAKQRRLVRRYQDRIAKESKANDDTGSSGDSQKEDVTTTTEDLKLKTDPIVEESTPASEGTEDGREQSANKEEDDDSSVHSSDSDHSDDKSEQSLDDTPNGPPGKESNKQAIAGDNQPQEEGKIQNSTSDEEINKDQVMALLEGLNSKQRRKLARQLEREGVGVSVLEQVREEAIRLKKETEESKLEKSDAASEKEAAKAAAEKKATKGNKRKRDLSDLTPEERMRRVDQRRKQQEAAERRAKEASDPNASKDFKHPLNSERRRANKRKPKWAKKAMPDFAPNEHDSSGFHMRTITKRDAPECTMSCHYCCLQLSWHMPMAWMQLPGVVCSSSPSRSLDH